jgi:hypothetical protein
MQRFEEVKMPRTPTGCKMVVTTHPKRRRAPLDQRRVRAVDADHGQTWGMAAQIPWRAGPGSSLAGLAQVDPVEQYC